MVMGELVQETDLLVIGAGPGGYAAAFRAADLGMDVTLVETSDRPGGVCLFRGCIPSKTYLHLAELLHDARQAREMGIDFGDPSIDLEGLRKWKQQVIDQLARGLVSLTERRGIQYLQGRAVFESSERVRVKGKDTVGIRFRHAIVAAGSRPTPLPGAPFGKGGRIMSSTGALNIKDIPESMLVIGGGYVGLELGMVYAALGTRITLVEMTDRILPGVDGDLVAPLGKRLEDTFEAMHFSTAVEALEEDGDGVLARFKGDAGEGEKRYDRALVAIGRHPNTGDLGLENTNVELDDKGFIRVDEQQRTSDKKILAIGDIVGGVMLAHKAMFEGKIAAEVIAGRPAAFDIRAIPAVVYTDPQIAYAGLTEEDARRQKRSVKVEKFPWKFSGRATTMGAPAGITKLIVDADTQRILGVGICGRNAESLVSEGVLAIEMGALAEDLALTIHPHPTLSETEGEAAEIFLGAATHILPKASR
ncbi:MAG: dihydrolipoyl dehydrogenase [Desulfobacterales bacterium]